MSVQIVVTYPDAATAVVEVAGEIDVATTPELRVTLHEVADTSEIRRVVVDLDAVEFIDSSGLGVLIGCARRLRAGGEDRELLLVCSRPNIIRVFEITALDTLFPMHQSVPEALKS
jgi:anti-sigma B factor antagonist